jgi:hypothetical protein
MFRATDAKKLHERLVMLVKQEAPGREAAATAAKLERSTSQTLAKLPLELRGRVSKRAGSMFVDLRRQALVLAALADASPTEAGTPYRAAPLGSRGGGLAGMGPEFLAAAFRAPHRHCYCLCDPGLPAGQVFWMQCGIFLCGTGGAGECCLLDSSPGYFGCPVPTCEPMPDLQNGDCQTCQPCPECATCTSCVVLANPANNGGPVTYLIDGQAGSIEAGEMQSVDQEGAVIRFDCGGGFGVLTHTLARGSYRFDVTDRGWKLFKTTYQATLDNTANENDFLLVHRGEEVRVPARSTHKIESAYPVVVAFDNGSGDQAVEKSLENGKTYTIGINDATGSWDLFAGDAAATGAAGYDVADASGGQPAPGGAESGFGSAPDESGTSDADASEGASTGDDSQAEEDSTDGSLEEPDGSLEEPEGSFDEPEESSQSEEADGS